jgi:hypothetical protein
MKIVRFYEDDRPAKIIKTGLTLEQAKAHCNDPETSSYTAKSPRGCEGNEKRIAEWHKKNKHWFDGFEN